MVSGDEQAGQYKMGKSELSPRSNRGTSVSRQTSGTRENSTDCQERFCSSAHMLRAPGTGL